MKKYLLFFLIALVSEMAFGQELSQANPSLMASINAWFKEWSGIVGAIAAFLIAAGVIYAFTGRLKRLFFGDIYKKLDKIENNELKHLDISLQQVRKTEDLTLDILLGLVPDDAKKAEALKKRLDIQTWYTDQLQELSKAPTKEKKTE
ncbi:hypothetical protein AGMMS49944_30860 [Spirochaetia bacterium]|nr:hypothetical protein AGMMS49944_30860 [Spirochaetia bacterium]